MTPDPTLTELDPGRLADLAAPRAGRPECPARGAPAGADAVRRAWLALEIALAGPPLWRHVAGALSPAQGNVFRQQMDALLDLLGLAGLEDGSGSRRRSREELGAARRAGALADLGARWQSLRDAAGVLRRAGYPEPARLAELQLPWGEPFFIGVVEYFLGRALRGRGAQGEDTAGLPEDDGGECWRCLETVAFLLEDAEGSLTVLLDRPEETPGTARRQGHDPEAVERLFQLGLTRHLHGEYQQAAAQFTAALKLDPTDPRLYTHRGEAYRLLCEYERAIADFQAALRLAPSNPAALVSRAIAYHQSGELARAVADCTAALELDPNQATAYRIRAAASAELGAHDQALADLTAAIGLAPDDDEARFQRGVVHATLRAYDRAIRDFDRVLRRNPHHVPAYLHRGHAHRCRADHAAAVRDYGEVLRHHPNNVDAYAGRALAHRAQGHATRAIADYTQVLRLEPDNARAACGRGALYRARGDLLRALADLDLAVGHEPDNWVALYHRSKVHLAQGRTREALADMSEAIVHNPGVAAAYVSRAVIQDRLGRYAEGLADSTEAIHLDAGSAAARLVRGVIHGHRGDCAAAVADLTEAIRLDDALALAYQERSMAHTLRGQHDLALADCDRLIALQPGNARAYANRSIVHHQKGNIPQALVDYSRAVQLDPRCILTGWNQGLAENARLETVQRLADYIDGLRPEPPGADALPPPKVRIVLKQPGAARPDPAGPATEQESRPAEVDAPAEAPQPDEEPEPAPEPEATAEEEAVLTLLEETSPRSVEPAAAPEAMGSADAAEATAPAPRPLGHCPICRGPTVACETLPGGLVRCGTCRDRIPAVAAAAATPQPAPVTRPQPRRAARKGADDSAGDFFRKWKKPGGAMAAGVALAVLLYFGIAAFARSHHVRVYPVHGKITFEGKPVPNATIILAPVGMKDTDFPGPRGFVKEDGSFELGTFAREDGVPAGDYRFTVRWFVKPQRAEVEGGALPVNRLPARYANFETSGLTLHVEAGDNQVPPIDLKR